MTDDGQLAENGAGALLVANGVTRHFPGIVALAGVDFDVAPGEVHALVGENGAGKSTLIKVLTGVYPPDGGSLWWQGRRVVLSDPQAAYRLGIAVIHQERQLVPDFTALENLYLGRRYPRRLGGLAVDWPAMRRRASAVMATLGVEVPLDVPVARLPPAARTVVELLRANLWECRLLFLDEPTAALTDREARALFGLIRRLQAQGTAFAYVSHRLEEIFELADRITVLRNGQRVATLPAVAADKEQLISLMAGQAVAAPAAGDATPTPTGEPLLTVREVATADGRVRAASLTLHAGEVLGLFGLAGAGRSELLAALYGENPRIAGTVALAGRTVRLDGARAALAAGIVLIPEDRRGQALVTGMSIRENMTLSAPECYRWGPGIIRRTRETGAVRGMIADLGIKATGPDQGVATLSGGNQQKVVLARCLLRRPHIFLCDEPTQGVDVKTRREIHQRLRSLAAAGAGVLFVSSDLTEMLEVCHRVLVMREGRTTRTLERQAAQPEAILQICYGGDG